MPKDLKNIIGSLIRRRRLAANMSQMTLANKMGISYQQLQKYEKGIDNISVYRLYQLSHALDIPINKFLDIEEHKKIAEDISEYGVNKDERTLLEFFRKIQNKEIRRGLLLMVKGIAGSIEEK
ncbi:MAG: helix-turn-helix transcriptional regulator [Nitrospirota bacterium]